MEFRKTGEKGRYWFRDRQCIGLECWAPGRYQHRGATLAGSRNTGGETLCCMTNAYHGCPDGRLYAIKLERERKAEGWRRA